MDTVRTAVVCLGICMILAGVPADTDRDGPTVVESTPVQGSPLPAWTEVAEKVDEDAAVPEAAAEPDTFSATKLWKLPDGTLVMGPELSDPDYNVWADLYVKPLLKKKNPVECEGGSCSKSPLKNEGVCKDGSCSKSSNSPPVQRSAPSPRRGVFRR